MINNRQAGRRNRGRNNGRPSGNTNRGNGDNGNRIDNRARGNAPQLLEKYRNMARDAQLAGDRVNAEYYLQFADHYFRVLADNRSRQEEQQARYQRNDEGFDETEAGYEESGNQGYVDSSGYGEDGEPQGNQREGRDQGQYQNRDQNQNREQNSNRDQNQNRDRQPRENRNQNRNRDGERQNRDNRPREQGRDHNTPVAAQQSTDRTEVAQADIYQPVVTDMQETVQEAPAASRARRAPRMKRETYADQSSEPTMLDLSVLPPAISRPVSDDAEVAEPVSTPRKRGRPPKVQAAE